MRLKAALPFNKKKKKKIEDFARLLGPFPVSASGNHQTPDRHSFKLPSPRLGIHYSMPSYFTVQPLKLLNAGCIAATLLACSSFISF